MLELDNRTPFPAALVPGTNQEGTDTLTVVAKGTFAIGPGIETPPVADEQVPLVWADEFRGEPDASSILYEADTAPFKPATDIVVIASAHPERGRRAYSVDVALRVADLSRTIRVYGDRRWYRSQGFWRMSDPEPFRSMPLTFERAYGGWDRSDPDPAKHDREARNPVGTGFVASSRSPHAEDLPLPNLEEPDRPIRDLGDRPAPVGTGFIGRSWAPRVTLAGTYDDTWLQERAPLLPEDFDERFFNGAHPAWIAPGFLQGGEPVYLGHLHPEGDLGFYLPRHRIQVSWCQRDEWSSARAMLDTVILEPPEGRLSLTWRARIPCPRQLLFMDRVKVEEEVVT